MHKCVLNRDSWFQQTLSFLCVIASLILGCSAQPDGVEYFWLSDGSRRTYDVKMLIPLTGVVEGTMVVREDGTATIEGHTYHKIVTTFEGIPGAESDVSYTRLAIDGIYTRRSTDSKGPENLEFPLPPEVGREWRYTQDDLTLDMEIISIEDFDTTEKTYQRCLRINGRGTKGPDRINSVSYYAPRVGLLKFSLEGKGYLMDLKLRSE